jgi:LAO/AO transport system kinase
LTVDFPETPLTRLRAGGKKALADALALIEAAPAALETIDLLDEAYFGAKAHVIGMTGPPGVGKSTLIAALIDAYRSQDDTVGVIAVDPSSHRSGGALLGDRVRIDTDPADSGIFIRSMAARDHLGGLAAMTAAAVVLMRAVYDRVIVETVGVGQSETDIASVADSVVLCVQPGSGDSLQYMKAGIAEIPDIALVTKADLGAVAVQTRRDLVAALAATRTVAGPRSDHIWQIPVLAISTGDDASIQRLLNGIDGHRRHLEAGPLIDRRRSQAEAWLVGAIREAYGSIGLEMARREFDGMTLGEAESPFRRLKAIEQVLSARFST